MDLEADLAGGEVFGELGGAGDLDAINPDRTFAADDEDLEVEPAALGGGGNAGALEAVDGAGREDGIKGRVDLDFEAAVAVFGGVAAEEDAAVGVVGGFDFGGEEEVGEDGGGVVDAVAIGAGGPIGTGLPGARIAEGPGLPLGDEGGGGGEFAGGEVADLVLVEEVGEVKVTGEEEMRGEGGALDEFAVLEDGELGSVESDFDFVPLIEAGGKEAQGGLAAGEGAGGVEAGLLVEVMGEEDGDALLDRAADGGSAEDEGGLGPLGETVFEGDLDVCVLAVAGPAGMLGEEGGGED